MKISQLEKGLEENVNNRMNHLEERRQPLSASSEYVDTNTFDDIRSIKNLSRIEILEQKQKKVSKNLKKLEASFNLFSTQSTEAPAVMNEMKKGLEIQECDNSLGNNGIQEKERSQELDMRDYNLNTEDEPSPYYGAHETQLSEGGESDLQNHFDDCKKNAGHKQFIPIDYFSITHISYLSNKKKIVQYIKATAQLTVRVAVAKTSEERPEFWPNTKQAYAFYNIRGRDVMRFATGIVRELYIYHEGACSCNKCKHSDTPSKDWGQIEVYTAAHVVFDDLEARHTTCRFFYNRKDSPLVTLNDWTTVDVQIDEDRCRLKCVTCDVDLLEILKKKVSAWYVSWHALGNIYQQLSNEDTLVLMVSHPHGCPQHVSVGHWTDRYEISTGRTRFTYTACTCPGSSGAYVLPLGYNHGYQSLPHLHSGVNREGKNVSGSGTDVLCW